MKIQMYGSVESSSGEETMIRQPLSSMNGDPKNHSYIIAVPLLQLAPVNSKCLITLKI